MKSADLKVGLEVLVLTYGSKEDLATANVSRGTVMSDQRWISSRFTSRHEDRFIVVNRKKVEIQGLIDGRGNRAVVHLPTHWDENHLELVPLRRILGPVDEWQPKIDEARKIRDAAYAEKYAKDQERTEQAAGFKERLNAAGIKALSVYVDGSVKINLGVGGIERLLELVERA